MFLRPKEITFKMNGEEYRITAHSVFFLRNKILPVYRPTYYLEKKYKDDSYDLIDKAIQVKTKDSWRDLIDFLIVELKANLKKRFVKFLTKFNS